MGRVKLRIRELHLNPDDNDVWDEYSKDYQKIFNEKNENDNIDGGEIINYEKTEKRETEKDIVNIKGSVANLEEKFEMIKRIKKIPNLCRICYCDDKEIDSPLLVPCMCSGSMKYIHYSCLQTW